MGDIAAYEPGPARATGGAGACALLIGAGAPFVLSPGLRTFSMHDTNDFFKPLTRRSGMYPVVDGPVSIDCYIRAAVECYERLLLKEPSEHMNRWRAHAYVRRHNNGYI